MLGVIGGSGFYSFIDDVKTKSIETPYGKPSSDVALGKIHGKDVAFIARHGANHQFPPHKIPYKANIWAFKELGVTRIIAVSAVGSLKESIKPGEFILTDQFVAMTKRDDTFYDEGTVHINVADPYCDELRTIISKELLKLNFPLHTKGTIVVIQGPRFSTKAESEYFRKQGWDIINMTQYPENVLAREQEICYANISLITDYDTGVKTNPNIKPVDIQEILRVLKENNEKIRKVIFEIIPKIPKERKCFCATALDNAKV
jgi:5'-methylthioadenosine phosphorylase